jgi:acetyl esterase
MTIISDSTTALKGDQEADLRHFLAEIGPRWSLSVAANVRAVVERYTPLLAAVSKDGVVVNRDIAYGSHPRQQLDVFAGPGAAAGGKLRPVVIFVHGGAFVDGERNRSDQVYANVLYYCARHELIGINIEYRLAPEHTFPAASEDLALAIEWTVRHAAEFGGDPDNIFLMGHSAGGAHVGTYVYDNRYDVPERDHIAGAVIISGRVRADNTSENPNARKVEAYYGTDATLYEELSPVSHVNARSMPTLIAFAEYENPLIDIYSLELGYRLAQAWRRAPVLMRLPLHNHTSMIAHINTEEDVLGAGIRAFIHSNLRVKKARAMGPPDQAWV